MKEKSHENSDYLLKISKSQNRNLPRSRTHSWLN